MRVIEKLEYNYSTELLGNTTTAFVYPEYVMKLRFTDTCPYCGTTLTQIYRTVTKEWYDDNYCKEKYECSGCQWWRSSEFPDRYFNGLTQIGLLHKISKIDNALNLAIDEIINNNEKIYKLDTKYFEQFVGSLLREFYDCQVIHVGKSHDGGIDLILLESNDGKIPIQVKRRIHQSKVEPVTIVRELRGAMVVAGYDKGMIVTTGDHFSREAAKISKPSPEHSIPQTIDLIDCRRLLNIMGLIKKSIVNT